MELIKPQKGILTKRQIEILKIMYDNKNTDDGEIIYEKGIGYLRLDRIAPRTIFALLRLCCISEDQYGGGIEHYHINETGEDFIKIEGIINGVNNG